MSQTEMCLKPMNVSDCDVSSDSVRLVSGRSFCSGSLQIRDQSLGQSWTSVCEGALDHRVAEVLCRELGCGAPVLQWPRSAPGQMFHCEGHESALMDCSRNQTKTNPDTCPGPALHLTCSELKLVGGARRCEGTVEAGPKGKWRRVVARGPYLPWDRWDLAIATVVCRELDCGSAVSVEERRGYNVRAVWAAVTDCVRTKQETTPFRDCFYGHRLSGREDRGLEVVCSGSVQLVSGRSLCSGLLQISDLSLGQSWTSVCEGALGRQGAEVLCRELGCGAPVLQGALSPLGQMFHCGGHESALMDCPRNQTRSDPGTCPGPALHLTCSVSLRLVGGASHCEGTVEARLRGEWRRVAAYDGWDLNAAAVVCRDVDCGSAVSTKERRDLNRSDVLEVNSFCVKKKSSVRDCAISVSDVDRGLEVVCSGHQEEPEGTELQETQSRP